MSRLPNTAGAVKLYKRLILSFFLNGYPQIGCGIARKFFGNFRGPNFPATMA